MASNAGANLARMIRNVKKQDFVVTNRVDQWLVDNPDLVMTDDDVLLMQRLLGQARGSRIGLWTGSQATTCERKQVFNFIGVPKLRTFDPRLQNLFHDGTWRHVRWQMMLTKAIPGFEAELPVSASSWKFLGAVDGVHVDESWGFELKGTSNFTKAVTDGVFAAHLHQATRYWLSCDEDPNFPELKSWVFVYEDKRSQEWRESVVHRDATVEKEVKRELRRLNSAVRDRELPSIIPECRKASGTTFRQCPYSDRCLTFKVWQDAEASAVGGTAQPVASQPVAVVARQRRKLAGH